MYWFENWIGIIIVEWCYEVSCFGLLNYVDVWCYVGKGIKLFFFFYRMIKILFMVVERGKLIKIF